MTIGTYKMYMWKIPYPLKERLEGSNIKIILFEKKLEKIFIFLLYFHVTF